MGIIFSLLGLGSPRQRLVRSLRGKTFIIPDLELIFHHWPYGVNPEVEHLQKELDQRMVQYFSGKILRKMQQADAAVFGASWWPYASYDTLYVAACLGLWLFAWDDETDSVEVSTLVNDSKRGAAFRKETKDYIRQFLIPGSEPFTSKNPLITNFEVIGVAIRDSCTSSQRETFLKELEYFIDMVDEEQKVLLSNRLPTVEEYQRRRMGSGAVGVCLAITEYAFKMEIPSDIMSSKEMHKLWDLTNIIIAVTNDIISLKKEIAQDQVDTIIPLLYLRYGSLQKAVDAAAEMIHSSVRDFDILAAKMLLQYSSDADVQGKLQKFIDGCKFACTANLYWGLRSKRYQLPCESLRGGLKVKL